MSPDPGGVGQVKIRHTVRALAVALVVCLMVLHAGLFRQVAAHAFQHARHQSATHGSPLCTWLCTAGEVSETVSADLWLTSDLVGPVEAWRPMDRVPPLALTPSSRGPPFPSR